MMWYPQAGGDLVFYPSYGGDGDDIEFKSSVDEMKSEDVPSGSGKKTSLADWLGLGKEVFQLINGVWVRVKDKQGRTVREVVDTPPPAPNYTPLIVGGLLLTTLIIGAAVLLKEDK